jgi:hypothetical protein
LELIPESIVSPGRFGKPNSAAEPNRVLMLRTAGAA